MGNNRPGHRSRECCKCYEDSKPLPWCGEEKVGVYLVLIAVCHLFSLAGRTHSPRGAQCGEATRVDGANYISNMHM